MTPDQLPACAPDLAAVAGSDPAELAVLLILAAAIFAGGLLAGLGWGFRLGRDDAGSDVHEARMAERRSTVLFHCQPGSEQ